MHRRDELEVLSGSNLLDGNLEAPPGFEPGVEVLQRAQDLRANIRHSSDLAFSRTKSQLCSFASVASFTVVCRVLLTSS